MFLDALVKALHSIVTPIMWFGIALGASGQTSLPAPVTVRFEARSPQAAPGFVVAPGSQIDWEIVITVTPITGHLGLAGAMCDFSPWTTNIVNFEAYTDMTTGFRGTGFSAQFDRPLGFANPPEPGSGFSSAFGGTTWQIGYCCDDNDEPVLLGRALAGIGGLQNTLGFAAPAGTPIAQATNIESGVGTQGEVQLASGSFYLPSMNPTNRAWYLGFGVPPSTASAIVIHQVLPNGLGVEIFPAAVQAAPAFVLTVICRADFNQSGNVGPEDIFAFLAAYFLGLPSADINGDGVVTVQDIFDFLALYFAGC